MAEHFLIAFESTGLGRRVRMYVRGKELYCIWNPGKLLVYLNRTGPLLATYRHFTDKFISLSSLSFGCLTRCLSS
jgi:hypothetical protein